MATIASLSYTSQLGYYGLRVNPTFEQVVGTVRKPLRIPLPDRKAKWYALSPYRALILDAEAKHQDYQHAQLDYRATGAHLPESAAAVRPSDAGEDPAFQAIHAHGEAYDHQRVVEIASDLAEQERRLETAHVRGGQLRGTYGPNHTDPTVEAMHDELDEAQVPHSMPAPRIAPLRRGWKAPAVQYVAAGQPQAAEFKSFEVLSMGQPENVNASKLNPSQNLTYERAREFVVAPTWSS